MATLSVKVTDKGGHAATSTVSYTVSTPPSTNKILMGGCGADNAEFNALNAAVGPLQCRRTFDGALPSSFATSKMAPDAGTGRTSIWSWKPNMTTFATSTTAQNAFRTFLGTIPANHKVILTAFHEPEDNINNGEFTLAQFKAVTNKVGQIVDEFGNTNIKTCFIVMGPWTFDNTSPYYPWDWNSGWDWNVIDYVGIDPYKFKPNEPTFRNMLTIPNYGRGGSNPSVMQKLSSWGKPVIIPEWACTETNFTVAQKAQWITDAYAWMKEWNANAANSVKIHAASYFNTNIFVSSNPQATWVLHDEALAAYQAIMNDARS